MAISVGDKLPDAEVMVCTPEGHETVSLGTHIAGKTVVIFALPGAYTGTCTTSHVPSFMRTRDALAERGVDEVICVSVNDPFVMGAWAGSTGATAAGLTMVADAAGAFTQAAGMGFDAPPAGLYGRSQRYSMLVKDGVVAVLNTGDKPGECDISAGETLLAQDWG